jgi:hypothetical protein
MKKTKDVSKCRSLVVTKSSAHHIDLNSCVLCCARIFSQERERDGGCGDLSFWDHYSKP